MTTIEDSTSLELYKKKLLAGYYDNDNDDSTIPKTAVYSLEEDNNDNKNHRRLKKRKNYKKIYRPHRTKTEHGMIIDAGSQGTRLHIYEFPARILKNKHDIQKVVHGLKLSFPTTDTRWTNKLKPGVSTRMYIRLVCVVNICVFYNMMRCLVVHCR